VDWVDDPFSAGGYSYVPVGADGQREVLARPIGSQLFFAGEATASAAFASTVHGAYVSGLRAAQEILFLQPGD
jgi:monoamine oxidase